MDCGTKRDWSTVPKQYRCGSRLVPWQDYFGTDTVLEFLLGPLPQTPREGSMLMRYCITFNLNLSTQKHGGRL